jgi:integrase
MKRCADRESCGHLTRSALEDYFSSKGAEASYPTISKIRDALSSILRSAFKDKQYLNSNPMEGLRLPKDRRARRPKPTITPEQFNHLLQLVSEPYATMIFVAVWTGLRVSELIGLKWRCIHADALTIEERFCRGDWSTPKTAASAATIGVTSEVITRLLRLPTLTVEVRAGRAVRKHKLVKSGGPDDLVCQSVRKGCAMNDQNILNRHIQPAAWKLGLPFVNWRCLRTSHATWLVQAGADPKSVQGQMRHSRSSTTMDIYAQVVSSSQRRALQQLTAFAGDTMPAGTRDRCDGSRFFGLRREKKHRAGSTFQFTFQNVPNSVIFQMSERPEKAGKCLKGLVELVGLEPTTSSLRTMRSPN